MQKALGGDANTAPWL